jgi:hypothetical protein
MSEAGGSDDVAYRWHQIMFRLDELDETVATGMTEDEAGALDDERASLLRELQAVEGRLGTQNSAALRAAHEHDRAYARQRRQIDEEAGS